MTRLRRQPALLATLAALLAPAFARAQDGIPHPWEMDLQAAAGPLKAHEIGLHDIVLILITGITLFVGVLLAWVMIRYRASKNPTPSRFSHNTVVEIAWTVVPVLILVVIAIPSFRLIYYEDRVKDADVTIKVTGHQWFWEYTYPGAKDGKGDIDFASYIVPDDQLRPGQLRLLAVDNELVVPIGKNIRILTASADVIHSFFIPSLGVQRYAIPGRTIETWLRVDHPGVFYGECNQICGTNHSRMPIAVRGVSAEDYAAWLEQAKTKFAAASPLRLARAN